MKNIWLFGIVKSQYKIEPLQLVKIEHSGHPCIPQSHVQIPTRHFIQVGMSSYLLPFSIHLSLKNNHLPTTYNVSLASYNIKLKHFNPHSHLSGCFEVANSHGPSPLPIGSHQHKSFNCITKDLSPFIALARMPFLFYEVTTLPWVGYATLKMNLVSNEHLLLLSKICSLFQI